MSESKKIAVIGPGCGSLGSGLFLAKNRQVVVLDIVPEKVEMLKRRISPIIRGLEAFGKISNVIAAKCVTGAAERGKTRDLFGKES